MARTSTGIDVGNRGIRALQLAKKGNGYQLVHFFARDREAGEESHAALQSAAAEAGWKLGNARIGITGKEVILRYSKVPPVPDEQLRNLMKFEIQDISAQAGGEICADFNLLPIPTDFSGNDTVLVALAKESLLEPMVEAQKECAMQVEGFTPNGVGLYNAYLKYGNPGKETVLLVNLGEENVDLAVVVGSDLYFARNLTGGSSLLTQAISQRFNVSRAKADLLKEQAVDLHPERRGQATSAQQEKVTQAVLGSAGQFPSMLQSTLMFCKSQTKVTDLKLDRVLLCGGGARVKGLPEYLQAAMNVPVERFDPFDEVDRSALGDAEAEMLDNFRMESVVALGHALATLDPDCYSIEILPEKLQKRREFLSKTVYLAAAGVVLIGFLVADFIWTRGEALGAEKKLKGLQSRTRQRKRTDKQAKTLLEKNERLATQGGILQQKVGAGQSLLQALRILQEDLPGDLWVQSVEVEMRSDPDAELGLSGETLPIVRVEGKGREGVEALSRVFRSFTEKIRSKVPGGALKQTTSTRSGFSFALEMNFLAEEGE